MHNEHLHLAYVCHSCHVSRMEKLREGFTTGTAAAAAAKAATLFVLKEKRVAFVNVPLPPIAPQSKPTSTYGGPRLEITVGKAPDNSPAEICVTKYAGDDPDVTDGAKILARASTSPFATAEQAGMQAPVMPKGFANKVFLYAGEGIGRVTLPGLPVAVGEPAINPASRLQIAAAACEAAAELGYTGPLHINIIVPEGEYLAQKTMNPRLGIVGGISILGTRGIVRPFSNEAWKDAIVQGFNVANALGTSRLLLSTGRKSEKTLQALYPEAPSTACVQVADFAGFSLRKAASMGFKYIAWGCFAGKLVKLAQGLEWTHAHSEPVNLDMPINLYLKCGGDAQEAEKLGNIPTAAGILAKIREESEAIYTAVMEKLGERALLNMREWVDQERTASGMGGQTLTICLHVFDQHQSLIVTKITELNDES